MHDFNVRLVGAKDTQRFRQPDHLVAGQKADDECRLLRPRCAACGFAASLDLKQCQARVVEEHPAGLMMSCRPSAMLVFRRPPMPKLTTQETHLLDQLADLNEARLAMGYGRLPSNTEAAMLAAIELVQKIGFSMRTADAVRKAISDSEPGCL
jgi:hypothetical protein